MQMSSADDIDSMMASSSHTQGHGSVRLCPHGLSFCFFARIAKAGGEVYTRPGKHSKPPLVSPVNVNEDNVGKIYAIQLAGIKPCIHLPRPCTWWRHLRHLKSIDSGDPEIYAALHLTTLNDGSGVDTYLSVALWQTVVPKLPGQTPYGPST